MRATRAGFQLAVLVAVAGSALGDPPRAAPHDVVRGDVLVWDDAKLLVDPGDPASAIQLATLGAPRTASVGAVFEMRVVATRGGLVEVVPAMGDECTRAGLQTSVEVPHLFVARADLAPVLATAFAAHFPDGSGVDLVPGTPVIPVGAGKALVRIEEHDLQLAIPASSIRYAYKPAGQYEPDAPVAHSRVYSLRAGTALSVAGVTWPAAADHDTVHAAKDVDHVLLQLDERCARVFARVDTARVRVWTVPEPKGDNARAFADLLTGDSPPEGDYVPAGTPLSTVRGHRVATASGYDNVTRAGKLACEDARFAITPPPAGAHPATVRLCAPARLVKTRVPDPRRPGRDLEQQIMQERAHSK